MSDDAQNEIETNPLEDMIQHALDQNYNKANDVFNDMMTVKMTDLLDQEKVKMADQYYNGVDPEEEGDEEDDQFELDLETEDDDEEEETWDDEEETEDLSS